MTPEERAEVRRRSAETDRLLLERIAYHRRKLVEERPGWTPPRTEEEWEAFHEERLGLRPPKP